MAALPAPAPAAVTRRCYGCNASFASSEGSAQRLCEACAAGAAAAAAPTPEAPAPSPALKEFLLGLLAGPAAAGLVYFVKVSWAFAAPLFIVGALVAVAMGRVLGPVRRREPLAVRAAGLAGAFISLLAVGLLSEALHG